MVPLRRPPPPPQVGPLPAACNHRCAIYPHTLSQKSEDIAVFLCSQSPHVGSCCISATPHVLPVCNNMLCPSTGSVMTHGRVADENSPRLVCVACADNFWPENLRIPGKHAPRCMPCHVAPRPGSHSSFLEWHLPLLPHTRREKHMKMCTLVHTTQHYNINSVNKNWIQSLSSWMFEYRVAVTVDDSRFGG